MSTKLEAPDQTSVQIDHSAEVSEWIEAFDDVVAADWQHGACGHNDARFAIRESSGNGGAAVGGCGVQLSSAESGAEGDGRSINACGCPRRVNLLAYAAIAVQKNDGPNSGFHQKGSVHTLGRHAATELEQQWRAS